MEWSERIGRRIRLRDLHILLAVVQRKSLAKAAKHLAISRPVVSRTINDLEQLFGVRLLERDRHGAEPTMYGTALLKRGTNVEDFETQMFFYSRSVFPQDQQVEVSILQVALQLGGYRTGSLASSPPRRRPSPPRPPSRASSLVNRPCRSCGSIAFTIGSSAAMHCAL
jgi:molybdenum-dependent DNA-binding transcriptional regulator ModE